MKRLFLFTFVLILFVVVSTTLADSHTREERAEIRFLQGMIDHHQMALDMANDCLGKAQSDVVLALCQGVIDTQTAEIEQMQAWLLEWYNIAYTPMSMNDMTMTMHGMCSMMVDMPEMGDMLENMPHPMGQMCNMMGGGIGMRGGMGQHGNMQGGGQHGNMAGREEAAAMPGMAQHQGPHTDPAMMMGMMAGFNRLEGAAYEIAWLEAMIDHHDDALHMSERIMERAAHTAVERLAQDIIDAQSAEIEQMETMILDLEASR